MICCYILHIRHIPDAEKALEFYSNTRTNDKKANVSFVVADKRWEIDTYGLFFHFAYFFTVELLYM